MWRRRCSTSRPARHIAVMHSRRWYWMQNASEHRSGRSSASPASPTKTLGANYAERYGSGVRGVLPNGTPVIVDNNVATNLGAGTNEDEIYLGEQERVPPVGGPERAAVHPRRADQGREPRRAAGGLRLLRLHLPALRQRPGQDRRHRPGHADLLGPCGWLPQHLRTPAARGPGVRRGTLKRAGQVTGATFDDAAKKAHKQRQSDVRPERWCELVRPRRVAAPARREGLRRLRQAMSASSHATRAHRWTSSGSCAPGRQDSTAFSATERRGSRTSPRPRVH